MRCFRFFKNPQTNNLAESINPSGSAIVVIESEEIEEEKSETALIQANTSSNAEDTDAYSMRDWLLYLLTVGSETALTAGFLLKILSAFDACSEDDEQSTCQDTLFYALLAVMPFLGIIHTLFAERVLLSKRDIPDSHDLSMNTLSKFAPVYFPVLGFAWAAMHELAEYFILREDPDTPLAENHSLLWGSLALAFFTSIPRAIFLYGELQHPQSETENQPLACLPRIKRWIGNLPRPDGRKQQLIVAAALLGAGTEGALAIEGLFAPLQTFGESIGKATKLGTAIPAMLINALLELNTTLANLKYLELAGTEKNYKSLIRLWLSASVIAIGPATGMIEFALTLNEGTSRPVLAALSLTTLLAAFQNEKTILLRMFSQNKKGNTNSPPLLQGVTSDPDDANDANYEKSALSGTYGTFPPSP